MARARNIKPGFFINDDLVELPFATRLLFIGLWTLADREGRLDDRPKKIKMSIFPADEVDVDSALTDLANAKLIERYAVDDKGFIEITNFTKHQSPHVKEQPSTIPAPYKPETSTVRAALIPDCPLPIPESPSSEEEETPQAASPAPEKKKPSIHPAIAAVRKITKSMPHEAIRDELIEALGNSPDEELLAKCFKTWVAKGWRPKNYTWITEWYVKGGPPEYSNGSKTVRPFDPGKNDAPIDTSVNDQWCDICNDEACFKDHRFDEVAA